MPKLIIENFSDRVRNVGIEPWAELEVLPPNGRFEIEYEEPGEISFSLDNDGATIGVLSRHATIFAANQQRTYTHE